MGEPETIYVVCATPRSGSGLLCEALWETALAGKPDEYFFQGTAAEYAAAWGTNSPDEYIRRVISYGTTSNGVFGFKIMWADFHHLQQEQARWLLSDPRYIWIRRQDKVRQGISLWKREQTGMISWFHDSPPQYENVPKFDFPAIDHLVQKARIWDESWAKYFQTIGVSPFVVNYEQDLEQDYRDTVRKILRYLNIAVPEDFHIRASRKKLSDELTENFVQLYHSLRT
jgi:LPS sulfotransferase NodH